MAAGVTIKPKLFGNKKKRILNRQAYDYLDLSTAFLRIFALVRYTISIHGITMQPCLHIL